MSNRFYWTTLHESLRNFLAFSSRLMFIRGTRTSSEYSCSPFCQASYEITEEIKRTRTKWGFLERVDRRIYPPSADWPTAITDLPLVLDFAIWQKFFERIRSYLFVLSIFLSFSLSLSLGKANGTARSTNPARSSNHDSIVKLSYSMAPRSCIWMSGEIDECRSRYIWLSRNKVVTQQEWISGLSGIFQSICCRIHF